MEKTEKLLGYSIPVEQACAYVFGELVKIAIPTIKSFHGDLYHDAEWIHDHITDDTEFPFTFHYQVRNTGTSIGITLEFMTRNPEPIHRLTVTRGGKSYRLTIESTL